LIGLLIDVAVVPKINRFCCVWFIEVLCSTLHHNRRGLGLSK